MLNKCIRVQNYDYNSTLELLTRLKYWNMNKAKKQRSISKDDSLRTKNPYIISLVVNTSKLNISRYKGELIPLKLKKMYKELIT